MFQIDLVAQCKANDRKAQMKLYDQYCNGMFCVAMRYLGNKDDAEDVVQESFIRAFQKINQYKGEVTFGAWLKKIVINKSIDFIRSNKRRFEELNESIHIVEDEDWNVPDGTTIKAIRWAMEDIPVKYKSVVQLFLIEGYDHGEIAQILNITESACRTRLLRGKGYLKELLKSRNYVTGS
ncbi:RNA polymerase sigma factor [Flavobacteriaceae bacterium F89]|uniref:RNA polymerase sigma factor n=1 Tax=Cerina litoralis TaxID=2874477 RepID=A0AAE3EU16_9FLAO|nr:RNA polymerase sigma factor [Cerina litoralis]MCG2460973.1 RNA polymerase sigma factor [Cerina litoralis]